MDVDRPYGRNPFLRHVLSRVSSDVYFPRVSSFGYLNELRAILQLVNAECVRAYVFFRRCTLPSLRLVKELDAGGHEIGLHLENSRSFSTFLAERHCLEAHLGQVVTSFSKHGSGQARFGWHHYAPYEPDEYIKWAQAANMKLFLGNLQDPTIPSYLINDRLNIFPSAFWLEPSWRDTDRYHIDWLLDQAKQRDIVMLIHPENILASGELTRTFKHIIRSVESKII